MNGISKLKQVHIKKKKKKKRTLFKKKNNDGFYTNEMKTETLLTRLKIPNFECKKSHYYK